MKRLLNWLSRPGRAAPARSPRFARPALERLDERLLPSATSALTTTHGTGWFRWQTHDLYAIDQTSKQVVDFQTSTFGGPTRTALGGPGNVRAVSASVDPNTGYAEVFAETWDLSLWRCDSHGSWVRLGGNGGALYGDISATRDGQVYAVHLNDQYVYLFHANGSVTNLGNPEGYLRTINGSGNGDGIAASVDFLGNSEVFAIGQQGALYVYNNAGSGGWQLIDNSRLYIGVSATEAGGVFANYNGLALLHWTEGRFFWHNGWFTFWSGQDVTGLGPYQDYWDISADTDAAGQDEVYARVSVGYNQYNLFRYDQGTWQQVDSNVSDVAAAGGGYFFDVNTGGTAWAYDLYAALHWTYLGNNVV